MRSMTLRGLGSSVKWGSGGTYFSQITLSPKQVAVGVDRRAAVAQALSFPLFAGISHITCSCFSYIADQSRRLQQYFSRRLINATIVS